MPTSEILIAVLKALTALVGLAAALVGLVSVRRRYSQSQAAVYRCCGEKRTLWKVVAIVLVCLLLLGVLHGGSCEWRAAGRYSARATTVP